MTPAPVRPFGLAPALAFVLALALYVPTLEFGFVWDDPISLDVARSTRTPSGMMSAFAGHAFAAAEPALGSESVIEYYRPVWAMSLGIDHALWGDRPFGFHLTNVLLHAVTSALVAIVAFGVLGSGVWAFLAGALFAVHPVHVEAVAWISARSDLLVTLFLLAALVAYRAYRLRGRARDGVLCLLSFAAALGSKETAIVFPALGLLEELRLGMRGRVRFAAPSVLAAMSVGFMVLRSSVVGPAPPSLPFGQRWLEAPAILLEYLRLMVVPHPLRVLYDRPTPTPMAAVLAVGVLAALACVAWLARRHRGVGFGIGWLLITLGPVLGIVATLRPAPIAERYLYLPSFGGVLAFSAGVAWFAASAPAPGSPSRRDPGLLLRRAVVIAGSGLILVVCVILAVRQSAAWRDRDVLAARMVADAPRSPLAHEAHGLALERQGDWAAARDAFRRGHTLAPDLAASLYNAGRMEERLGNVEAAARDYRDALALNPRYGAAAFALGHAFETLGRWNEAVVAYRYAAGLGAGPEAHFGLAISMHQLGDLAGAEREYRATLALRPADGRVRQNLGNLYLQKGRYEEARRELELAARLEPRLPQPHANLGDALRALHDDEGAERSYRRALAIDSTHAPAHAGLARVLMRTGRGEEALDHLRRAGIEGDRR
jgi:tetratricopeptide (TPR) repeat protein